MKITPRLFVLSGFVFVAAAARLIPDIANNFQPIFAMALFGGATFEDRRQAFLIPLAALVISDWVLGFHNLMLLVYLMFVVTVVIGLWVRKQTSIERIALGSFVSATLFFLVTNFGVWIDGSLYPLTTAGLVNCYTMALPFYGRTLLSFAVFGTLLFGGFWMLQREFPKLRMHEPRMA
ncbi:MAG: DUF6580 family putative transport protein [Verrucomicrobiae bacterium]|nr:DUF6580 family putative transport protein [Verrucomicrobiae bacterium]